MLDVFFLPIIRSIRISKANFLLGNRDAAFFRFDHNREMIQLCLLLEESCT
jgi:hypothetical protein